MPDNHATTEPIATGDEARHRSLIDDLSDATKQARAYFAAEIAYQKSRAAHAGAGIKTIALLLLAALIVACLAVVGLVIAGIMALALILPTWAAALAVGGGLAVLALLLVMLALGRWRSLSRALGLKGDSA